jgi:hypothetical protein
MHGCVRFDALLAASFLQPSYHSSKQASSSIMWAIVLR